LDFHVRNHRAGRIYDETDQRTGNGLSHGAGADQEHQA
jgi:hypothetical protein